MCYAEMVTARLGGAGATLRTVEHNPAEDNVLFSFNLSTCCAEMVAARLGGAGATLRTVDADPAVKAARGQRSVVAIGTLRAGVCR